MQILTTSGYVNIEDANIGDELVAYEVGTGNVIINTLLKKEEFSNDENDYYQINSNWIFNQNQSIWRERSGQINVVHVKDLQVGDIVFNDQDEDIEIVQIDNYVSEKWWRLEVSGDHSYIADAITLHNASRYWVGGGSSANWNATANTNWGSASGVQDNSSVPTSVDDVTLDGAGTAGNSNSTISATITIKSLNITTGYTSTMTHNAVLTIAGSWTMSNNYNISGTSDITISAGGTITSNSKTWPNGINIATAGIITVLTNFICSGITTVSAQARVDKTTSETWSTAGLAVNSGQYIAGSSASAVDAEIILTGGTWSGTGIVYSRLTLAGNVTISGTISYARNTLKYTSGTITTTGSTLTFVEGCTLNTNGITWNNVTISTSGVITLSSNFICSGSTTISAQAKVNPTISETYSTNGLTVNSGQYIAGSSVLVAAEVILTGGTWSGTGTVYSPLTLAGNVTVSGTVTYSRATMKYTSGTITTTGSTLSLTIEACTLNTNGINWNNVIIGVNVTVNSLLNVTNTLTLTANTNISFSGTSGWTCATLLNASTQAATITLKDGNTYTINSLLDCYQSRVGSAVIFTSSSATLKAILTLVNGASCKCLANFTRIDALAGRTINTFGGTITSSDNIRQFYDLTTVSYSI